VWFGSNNDALVHFAKLGYAIPENTNPSDFFLDITTLDQRTELSRKETSDRIEVFASAYNEIQATVTKPALLSENAHGKIQWPSMWISEFGILLQRNLANTFRDNAAIGATLGQSVFLFVFRLT
jgi:hypothetical protein